MERIYTMKKDYNLRLPTYSEISELVTDGDDQEILTDNQRRALEIDLEQLCEEIWEQLGHCWEARENFFRAGNAIAKAYGIKLKR